MADLNDQIELESSKAANVSNDGVSVGRRSIHELIEADKHLKANAAVKDIRGTVQAMSFRIVPPGGH